MSYADVGNGALCVGNGLVFINLVLNIGGRVRPMDSTPATWWTMLGASVVFFFAGLEYLIATRFLEAGFSFFFALIWWPKRRRPKRDEKKATWKMPAWMAAMMKPPPKLAAVRD